MKVAERRDPAPLARVMIADDNEDQVSTLATLLHTEGYAVRGSPSGTELLAQVTTFRPQVVILDIGMPDMTGYDVARALRTNSKSSDVLLIALTCYNTQTDRLVSKLAGFDYHIAKPVDPNNLSAIIRDYLAGNRPARIHVIPDHDIPR